MAAPLSPSLTESITHLLSRLQSKQSVQSIIVLDQSNGSIIQSSGSITARANENLANEYAAMVWKFVKSAEEMVKGMDDEDALRLLRLRTKSHELCIVPDPRFLLIVIHDTPSSG